MSARGRADTAGDVTETLPHDTPCRTPDAGKAGRQDCGETHPRSVKGMTGHFDLVRTASVHAHRSSHANANILDSDHRYPPDRSTSPTAIGSEAVAHFKPRFLDNHPAIRTPMRRNAG